MLEREGDLSIFVEMIPDSFVKDTRNWYDDIPGMPEPGHGRFEASRTYERILDAFTQAQKEKRQFVPQGVSRIFEIDKEGIIRLRGNPSFARSLDYSLNNVLAIGVWYETAEFEKAEGSTARYQALKQVNALIRQAIDPNISAQ